MSPCRNLLDLNDDILHLILQQLDAISPTSLPSLVRVSKACRKLAYPVLCRSIKLPSQEWWAQRGKNVTEDLMNKDHEISRHVREIIMPYTLGSGSISVSSVMRILGNVQTLKSVRWHSQANIPECLISKLEQKWPELKLHVYVPFSSEGRIYPDVRLLSSPLLSSLELDILWEVSRRLGEPVESLRSNICIIARMISQSPRLESLNLSVSGIESREIIFNSELEIIRDMIPSESDILFPEGFQLPQLQEIVWPSWNYVVPGYEAIERQSTHDLTYMLLSQVPKWTHLKYLKLSGLSIQLPFKQLEGRVPNLRVLHIVFDIKRIDSIPAALSFISSLDSLEELSIINKTGSINSCWAAIDKHKKSLCKVAVYSPPSFTIGSAGGGSVDRKRVPLLTSEQVEELLYCHNISDLKIDISVEDAEWFINPDIFSRTTNGTKNVRLGDTRAALLTKFTHLRRLRLTIELHEEASLFSDAIRSGDLSYHDRVTPLHEAQAKRAVIGLLEQIFSNDPQSGLEEIKLKFATVILNDILLEYTPVDCSFSVTRSEKKYGRDKQVHVVGDGIKFYSDSRNCFHGWDLC